MSRSRKTPRLTARTFNGVDQYGVADWVAARVNPFAVGGAQTYLVRVKMAVPASVVTLAGFSSDATNAAPTARVYVGTAGAAHWFQHSTGTVGGDAAGPIVADLAWHALAVVDDNGAIATYLDGAAGPTGAIARPGAGYVPGFWSLACVRYSGTAAQYVSGDVSEVAVLNRALSADEIARWSAGTLDLRAYGEDLILWDWGGAGGDKTARGANHGAPYGGAGVDYVNGPTGGGV